MTTHFIEVLFDKGVCITFALKQKLMTVNFSVANKVV